MKFRAIYQTLRIKFASFSCIIGLLLAATFANAQQLPLKIGFAAPLSGNYAALGKQMRIGAEAAFEALNLPRSAYQLADTRCEALTAKGIAEILRAKNVTIVVGFACSEALEAALEVLGPAGIPIITPASRNAVIAARAKKENWPLFRLTPSSTAERSAVGPLLIERFAPTLFAIIDDGTIYGRELSEAFRFYMEENQLKPVFIDTFRPQMDNQIGLLGRLRKAGATHLFAAGDYDDIAIIARDAKVLDYTLTIAGGEALRAAPITQTMPDNITMVAPKSWETLDAAAEAIDLLTAQDINPEGYVLPTMAAVEIALQSHSDDLSVTSNLQSGAFRTAIGTIHFDNEGAMTLSPFALHVSRNGTFQLVK